MKTLLPFLLVMTVFAQDRAAQEKGIPPSAPLNIWDVRYSELEPRLERQLADDPESLPLMDDLARVYRAQGRERKATQMEFRFKSAPLQALQ